MQTVKNKKCPICDTFIWSSSSYCKKHCLKTTTFQAGNKHPKWKGGKLKTIQGYIKIYAPSHPFSDVKGYVPGHRLVMEFFIKRFLLKTEDVHHVNHIKDDNRISNLRLLSHEEHGRFHAVEEWAKRGTPPKEWLES